MLPFFHSKFYRGSIENSPKALEEEEDLFLNMRKKKRRMRASVALRLMTNKLVSSNNDYGFSEKQGVDNLSTQREVPGL